MGGRVAGGPAHGTAPKGSPPHTHTNSPSRTQAAWLAQEKSQWSNQTCDLHSGRPLLDLCARPGGATGHSVTTQGGHLSGGGTCGPAGGLTGTGRQVHGAGAFPAGPTRSRGRPERGLAGMFRNVISQPDGQARLPVIIRVLESCRGRQGRTASRFCSFPEGKAVTLTNRVSNALLAQAGPGRSGRCGAPMFPEGPMSDATSPSRRQRAQRGGRVRAQSDLGARIRPAENLSETATRRSATQPQRETATAACERAAPRPSRGARLPEAGFLDLLQRKQHITMD